MAPPRIPPGTSAAKLALAARQFRADVGDPDLLLAQPLAIVGMACRFPGGAHSVDEYWKLLVEGRDAIVEVPAERWDIDAYFDSDPDVPGKMNTRWGGFLQQPAEMFDPTFFGIAPREAASMDPQQRLLLEVAWEALEDAGLTLEGLAGTATGAFFSVYGPDYSIELHRDRHAIDAYTTAGTVPCLASGRLSFLLDLQGPSLVVDTACSSSLVAVHLAAQSLRTGECRVALAGASSLTLTPDRNISLSKWRFMAPDGRCKPFDVRADGWVRGEGAGVVVLKRLADALADGDRVLAVIRGSAVNQDGRSSVMTAPNGQAQQAVVRAALKSARVAPQEISYVEAHGTGTSIGDPIELEALAEVLGTPADGRRCLIGAVKSNIGHLEAAAGMAGLIKTVLALRHELIPANLHFTALNPLISLDGTRLQIADKAVPWTSADGRRLAGVSSFGFSGTNAHVILEEAPALPAPAATASPSSIYLLPMSARSSDALTAMQASYAAFLEDAGAPGIGDICWSAATRRTHHDHRAVAVGATRQELLDALSQTVAGTPHWQVVRGHRRLGRRLAPVFVFSGQGPQWWAMGRELMREEPIFAAEVNEVDRLLRQYVAWSLVDELSADETTSRLSSTEVAQPALFAIQAGLCALLSGMGVKPGAVIGHSVGEIAAAMIAGAIDMATAVRIVSHRARVMQQATGLGKMAALGVPASEATRLLAPHGGAVDIAAINGPRSVTISGDAAAVEAVMASVLERQQFARLLPVDYAFHSRQMTPHAAELAAALGRVGVAAPRIPIYSTVTGAVVSEPAFDASYWAANVRQGVQFWPAVEQALAAGYSTFLELAPNPVLLPSLRQAFEGRGDDAVIVPTLQRGRPERLALRVAVAALHANGVEPSWPALLPSGGRVVSLPAYRWQRQPYWAIDATSSNSLPASGVPKADGALPGRRLRSLALSGAAFESTVDAANPSFVRDHMIHGTVLFPAAAFLLMAAKGVRDATGEPAVVLERVSIREPLPLAAGHATTLQLLVGDPSNGVRTVRIASTSSDQDDWQLHVEGTASVEAAPFDDLTVPDGARLRCPQTVDAALFYADLAAMGVEFGPAFRTLQSIHIGEREAVVEVVRPADVAAGDLDVHPVVLDGCLQALFAALPERIRTGHGEPYVPVGFGRLMVQPQAADRLICHVELTSPEGADEVFTGRVRAFTPGGAFVLAADDVTVKRAPRTALLQATRRSTADWMHEVTWQASPRSERTVAAPTALVVGGGDEFSHALAATLTRAGGRAVAVAIDASDGVLSRAIAAHPLDAVVFCAFDALEPSAAEPHIAATERRLIGGVLRVAQSLIHAGMALPGGFNVVTRGAQPVAAPPAPAGLLQAPVAAMMRTLAIEHPELQPRTIDLDERPAAAAAEAVSAELQSADGEDAVAIRGDARFVARLTKVARAPGTAAGGPVKLTTSTRGLLENLSLVPATRRPLDATEVEIAVEAAGLNFRDVLNALGMYPGDAGPLGHECAGTVEAVGSAVTKFKRGDRVVAVARDCFASYAVARQQHVARLPEGLDFDAAATLPVVFMTARYGLERLAGMRKGDRVLIHAGAGGVGIAAIQLAHRLGAEVYATAGSAEKQAYLRSLGVRHVMSSRTLAFESEIRALTGGRGVDIALNSLAGEFIPRTLAALAQHGRFVEIGKTGIWTAAQVAAARPDVSYHVLDLGTEIDADPELGQMLLEGVLADLAAGTLAPLPHRVFGLADAAHAFRFMAQARHIGKVVLRVESAGVAKELIRPDATYLITGGTGGLGLAMAEALARGGARRLVLASRRPRPAAEPRLERLRETGVAIDVATADVSRVEDVERVVGAIAKSGSPLGGIIHAAGALDDAMVVHQTWDKCEAALAGKALGAWNLHQVTKPLPIDFFVMFSSVASVIGSAGQSNYAAANGFLDALAHFRRGEGLPAVALNWGAWADAGMAADLSDSDRRRWAAQGVEEIEAEQGATLCLQLLQARQPQLTVLPISWRRYGEALGSRTPSPLLGDLVRRARGESTLPMAAGPELRQRLIDAPAGRRMPLLITAIAEYAVRVLALPAGFVLEPHQGLRDVGLDSLMAIELRNRLQDAVGTPLPATLAFDYPTVASLAEHLATAVLRLPLTESESADGGATDSADDRIDEVSELSDSEAEELLRQELAALKPQATRRHRK